jgi:DNA helicase HerA-like ATPase
MNRNNGYPIGKLRSGNQILKEHLVYMPSNLVGNRTAIFAQAGFGKSNLVRVLLWQMMNEDHFGKLVFDQRGEYAKDTQDESGNLIPGLYHHPDAKDNLVLFTSKKKFLSNNGVEVKSIGFDLKDISVVDLLFIYPHFTDAQRELLYFYEDDNSFYKKVLRQKDGSWDESNWQKDFVDWLSTSSKSGYTPLRSIRKKLTGVQKRLFFSDKSALSELLSFLKEGKMVIVDLSGLGELDQMFVSSIICRALFEHNMSNFELEKSSEMISTVVFFEEAQNLLSPSKVQEGSIFVRLSKEGRALLLGVCAITQQPSAIDRQLLSQFNTFVALHLEFMDDIEYLKRVAGNFAGLEQDLRRKIPGNAYLVTRDKPFAIPLRVEHFTEEFINNQSARKS